jgi:hypothetical protein
MVRSRMMTLPANWPAAGVSSVIAKTGKRPRPTNGWCSDRHQVSASALFRFHFRYFSVT